MQPGTGPGDGDIHRQDPAVEGRQYLVLQPIAQHGALAGIPALQQQDADLQFLKDDDRQVKPAGVGPAGPSRDLGVSLAGAHLAQLGQDIGIQ
jgi:hypothetical protein